MPHDKPSITNPHTLSPQTSPTTTTSFVYPVKSLLSGRIQPAAISQLSPPSLNTLEHALSTDDFVDLLRAENDLPDESQAIRASRSDVQGWTKDVTDIGNDYMESERDKKALLSAVEGQKTIGVDSRQLRLTKLIRQIR